MQGAMVLVRGIKDTPRSIFQIMRFLTLNFFNYIARAVAIFIIAKNNPAPILLDEFSSDYFVYFIITAFYKNIGFY